MTECSYCHRELERGAPVTLEQTGYTENRRVGAFCDYECVVEYIEDRGLTDVDPTPPEL